MKIKDLLEFGIKELESFSDNPRNEIEILILEYTNYKRIDLIVNVEKEINGKISDMIIQKINIRKSGMPIQYIVGNQEFMGLKFKVNENVLIPRQDTEILIDKILRMYSNKENLRVLDIGAGSGAISISLAKYLKNSEIVSVDISKKALDVAKENALLNGVSDRIKFIKSDLFENLTDEGKFDIIVSNPPYIKSEDIEKLQVEIKKHEPNLALDGGIDGLGFYRKISKEAIKHLVDKGLLAYEVGFDQGEDIKKMLLNDFCNIEILKDFQNLDRVVIGIKIVKEVYNV
ncbi:peptide chain release factor N(5)-glutamine methyltransferase [Clostridiaceae bacterium HSG29]|nr:peptide chain release factor N(5)-glutamine methyltransferase [Clostridiaceae bacterium HSG29]